MIKLTPKYFALPILALVVIGSLPAPADTGATTRTDCGPAQVTAPAMRAAFDRFERSQSAAARKVCALFNNSMDRTAIR